jgi:hypothetical protein
MRLTIQGKGVPLLTMSMLLWKFVTLQGGPLGQLCFLMKSFCNVSYVGFGLLSFGNAGEFLFLHLFMLLGIFHFTRRASGSALFLEEIHL